MKHIKNFNIKISFISKFVLCKENTIIDCLIIKYLSTQEISKYCNSRLYFFSYFKRLAYICLYNIVVTSSKNFFKSS